MSCYAVSKTPIGQPFPRSSRHTIWVDEDLPDWINQEEGNVFSYKLTTLTKRGEVFIQDGNAPNYQGDRITLCTCMRWHRTWPRRSRMAKQPIHVDPEFETFTYGGSHPS